MTTRHTVTDTRTYANLDCGPAWTGLLRDKYQVGANDPLKRKAVNPYSMTETLVTDGLIEWTYPGSPGVYHTGTVSSCFGGVSVPLISFDSNDNNKLIGRLGERIHQHGFNAAVSIGAEGREALDQVAAKTMEVVRGFRDLRKGNVQGALREFGLSPKQAKKVGLHKDLSGRVLATQLGWIPLLSDVKDGSEAFHALTKGARHQTYSVRLRKTAPVTLFGTAAGSAFKSRRIVWVLSEQLSWNESLGLSNPWDMLDAVWNATTLSFIADWFIPIGGYLEARSLASTLKGSGYYTDFYHVRGECPAQFGVYIVRNNDVYKYYRTEVSRVLLSSLDGLVSLPRWKDFRSVPSWRRALTAVALATQMFA